MFTTQHYVALAKALGAAKKQCTSSTERIGWHAACDEISVMLADDNGNFSHMRFRTAIREASDV